MKGVLEWWDQGEQSYIKIIYFCIVTKLVFYFDPDSLTYWVYLSWMIRNIWLDLTKNWMSFNGSGG